MLKDAPESSIRKKELGIVDGQTKPLDRLARTIPNLGVQGMQHFTAYGALKISQGYIRAGFLLLPGVVPLVFRDAASECIT